MAQDQEGSINHLEKSRKKQTAKQYLLEQYVLFYKLVQTRSASTTKRKTNVKLSRDILFDLSEPFSQQLVKHVSL